MRGRVFIDTNIWVYAKLEIIGEPKHQISKRFLARIQDEVYISTQVINEFFNDLYF